MAAINSPVPLSIPIDIRKELVNPLTPWEVSQELFGQLKFPAPGAQYKKVQILPDNKEWRFIWRYFFHLKPVHYTIKQVHFIHERNQQQTFVSNLSSIEREATTFPPTWDKESRTPQRYQAIERWKETAQIFSSFKTQEADGRVRSWEHTKVLPLWHGTNAPICDSICTSGFVYFGKAVIPGGDGAAPKSTDDGYFGSGIYFTNSARYAADIYSKGHLLLAWVSMREPFPVIGDPNQTDMATLRGRGAYKNYNAHYVPVASLDPGNPNCSEYHPVEADQTPACDEYVVFQKSQALPQYWVELEVELPYIQVPGDSPRFAGELIPHLMRILQNPQIDRDLKLRDFLNKHLAILLKLPSHEDLSPEQIALYEQITQLITPQGINQQLRNQMVGVVPALPALPDRGNSANEEEKVPPRSGFENQQIGAFGQWENQPQPLHNLFEPQPIDKLVADDPGFVNSLIAIQEDRRALEHAIKELKGDREFILAAVQKDWRALEYASEKFKGDREIVLAAVQQHGFALEFASEQLRSDREFILVAVQQHGYALQFASEELKGDREFVLVAVQRSALALQYASKQFKGDREFVLAAVQQNGLALKYASEQLKGDREFILAAIQRNGSTLEFASKQLKGDREIVLAAVQQNGNALSFASEELKGDRGIVLAAVQQKLGSFAYASEELIYDRDFILAAVQQNGNALLFASEELKGDREIVLAAVQQITGAVAYASEELKGDREFVHILVQIYGQALLYTSEQLKGDREIVFAAVQQDGLALQYASEKLQGDRKIVLAAVKQNGDALKYASKQLQADKKIRSTAGL